MISIFPDREKCFSAIFLGYKAERQEVHAISLQMFTAMLSMILIAVQTGARVAFFLFSTVINRTRL